MVFDAFEVASVVVVAKSATEAATSVLEVMVQNGTSPQPILSLFSLAEQFSSLVPARVPCRPAHPTTVN